MSEISGAIPEHFATNAAAALDVAPLYIVRHRERELAGSAIAPK
jgi:hypothetical protein